MENSTMDGRDVTKRRRTCAEESASKENQVAFPAPSSPPHEAGMTVPNHSPVEDRENKSPLRGTTSPLADKKKSFVSTGGSPEQAPKRTRQVQPLSPAEIKSPNEEPFVLNPPTDPSPTSARPPFEFTDRSDRKRRASQMSREDQENVRQEFPSSGTQDLVSPEDCDDDVELIHNSLDSDDVEPINDSLDSENASETGSPLTHNTVKWKGKRQSVEEPKLIENEAAVVKNIFEKTHFALRVSEARTLDEVFRLVKTFFVTSKEVLRLHRMKKADDPSLKWNVRTVLWRHGLAVYFGYWKDKKLGKVGSSIVVRSRVTKQGFERVGIIFDGEDCLRIVSTEFLDAAIELRIPGLTGHSDHIELSRKKGAMWCIELFVACGLVTCTMTAGERIFPRISEEVRAAVDFPLSKAVQDDLKNCLGAEGVRKVLCVQTWITLPSEVRKKLEDRTTPDQDKEFLKSRLTNHRQIKSVTEWCNVALYGDDMECRDCVTRAPRQAQLAKCVEAIRNENYDILKTIQKTSNYVEPPPSELRQAASQLWEEVIQDPTFDIISVERCTVRAIDQAGQWEKHIEREVELPDNAVIQVMKATSGHGIIVPLSNYNMYSENRTIEQRFLAAKSHLQSLHVLYVIGKVTKEYLLEQVDLTQSFLVNLEFGREESSELDAEHGMLPDSMGGAALATPSDDALVADAIDLKTQGNYREARNLAMPKRYFLSGHEKGILSVANRLGLTCWDVVVIRMLVGQDVFNKMLVAQGILRKGCLTPLEPSFECVGALGKGCPYPNSSPEKGIIVYIKDCKCYACKSCYANAHYVHEKYPDLDMMQALEQESELKAKKVARKVALRQPPSYGHGPQGPPRHAGPYDQRYPPDVPRYDHPHPPGPGPNYGHRFPGPTGLPPPMHQYYPGGPYENPCRPPLGAPVYPPGPPPPMHQYYPGGPYENPGRPPLGAPVYPQGPPQGPPGPPPPVNPHSRMSQDHHGPPRGTDSMMSYESLGPSYDGRPPYQARDYSPLYQGPNPPHAPSWGSAQSNLGHAYGANRGNYPGMRNYSEDRGGRTSPPFAAHPGMRMLPPHYQPPANFQPPPSMVSKSGPQNAIIASPHQPTDEPYVGMGSWTDHEDAILMEAMATSTAQHCLKWAVLEKRLPGRTRVQIRDRWVNHLNPKLNHLPFSREDDLLLWKGHKKLGKHWAEISTKYFNSTRSGNKIKNRWYSATFKKFISNEFGPDAYNGGNEKN